MEVAPQTFLETLSTARGLDLGEVLASRVAKTFVCKLEYAELGEWKEKLAEKMCAVFGFNELETEPELFRRWHEAFDEMPRQFLQTFTPQERKNLGSMRSVSWRLAALVAKLDRLHEESEGRSRFKWVGLKHGGFLRIDTAAREARSLREVARAWRELELREFELWAEFKSWRGREQKLFCWMYRSARLREDRSALWLKAGIPRLAKRARMTEITTKRALAGLRGHGVVGWVLRGNSKIHQVSVYWIARSVKAVRWGRLPKGKRRRWSRKPLKQ